MQWHTPIGYKVMNGKIVVYEEHKKLVEQIFRDYDSGISTWRIAKNLKEQGIENAKGRVTWTHASIGTNIVVQLLSHVRLFETP